MSIVYLCGEVTVSVARDSIQIKNSEKGTHTHACTHLNFFTLSLFKTSWVGDGTLHTALGFATLIKSIPFQTEMPIAMSM